MLYTTIFIIFPQYVLFFFLLLALIDNLMNFGLRAKLMLGLAVLFAALNLISFPGNILTSAWPCIFMSILYYVIRTYARNQKEDTDFYPMARTTAVWTSLAFAFVVIIFNETHPLFGISN